MADAQEQARVDNDTERRLGSSYVLETVLGRGASGEVWAGRDTDGHRWAFKLLHPEMARDSSVVRRFMQERELLTSIQDPHVVGVHDLVAESGTLGIVMELVEGSDLRSVLRERRTLPPALAARWGAQVATGLAAAHTYGAVHRDVKPENVLLDETVEPASAKLTDFGIARLATEGQQRTMMLGTPHYMAPEVVEGQVPTPASDLYSLGVMLYEMCCGVTPFAGRSATMNVLRAHCTERPGRPAGIPDALWSVIDQLVSKAPPQRRFSARDLASRLDRLADELEGVPASAPLTQPPPTVPLPPADRTVISDISPIAPLHPGPTVSAPGMPHPPPGMSYPPPPGMAHPPGGSFPGAQPTPYPGHQSPYISSSGAWMSGGPGTSMPGYQRPAGPPPPPPPRETQKKGSALTSGVVAFAVVLFVIMGGFAIWYLTRPDTHSGPTTPAVATGTPADNPSSASQPTPDPERTGKVPESGLYTGIANQTARSSGGNSGRYAIEMYFDSSGSWVHYMSTEESRQVFDCQAPLQRRGWDSSGRRLYEELKMTRGTCESYGMWAIEVISGNSLRGVYIPTSGDYQVDVDLTR